MNKNDRTWAQLNKPAGRSIAPKPIGYINKQNRLARMAKAIALFLTTNYSWTISWHQAAR
jgi:hypothetical protein